MKKAAIFVLGFHRSGTSAATRMVNLLGARIADDLWPAGADNPTGFWEPREVINLHEQFLAAAQTSWMGIVGLPDEIFASVAAENARAQANNFLAKEFASSKLLVIKDPRLCLTMPLWQAPLHDNDADPLFLLPLRHPLEAAASLHQRNGLPIPLGLLLWLRNTLSAELFSRGSRRAVLSYEELLSDWRSAMNAVGKALGLTWPVAAAKIAPQVAKFLSAGLRHHNAAKLPVVDGPAMAWATTVHGALAKLTQDPAFDAAPILDRVRAEMETALAPFAPGIRHLEQEWDHSTRVLARRNDHISALNTALDSVRDELNDIGGLLAQDSLSGGALKHVIATHHERMCTLLSLDGKVVGSAQNDAVKPLPLLASTIGKMEGRLGEVTQMQQHLAEGLERFHAVNQRLEEARALLATKVEAQQRLQRQVFDAERRMDQEMAAHAERERALQAEMDRQGAAHAETKKALRTELEQLSAAHTERERALQAEKEEALRTELEQLSAAHAERERALQAEMDRLGATYAEKEEALRTELEQLSAAHAERERALQAEMDWLGTSYAEREEALHTELEQQSAAHAERERALQAEMGWQGATYAEREEALRTELEQQSAANQTLGERLERAQESGLAAASALQESLAAIAKSLTRFNSLDQYCPITVHETNRHEEECLLAERADGAPTLSVVLARLDRELGRGVTLGKRLARQNHLATRYRHRLESLMKVANGLNEEVAQLRATEHHLRANLQGSGNEVERLRHTKAELAETLQRTVEAAAEDRRQAVLRVHRTAAATRDLLVSKFSRALARWRAARLLLGSGLFASAWYVETYPHVANYNGSPVMHYLRHGVFEGLLPNALFDTVWYLTTYPEVAESGINPLLHYLLRGADELRNPGPLFDTRWYATTYADVAAADVNPLGHFLKWGHGEGRTPTPGYALPPTFTTGLCAEAYRKSLSTILHRALRKVTVRKNKGLPSAVPPLPALPFGMGNDFSASTTTTDHAPATPEPYSPMRDRYRASLADAGKRLAGILSEELKQVDGPTISIVMPVYKVPLVYLERAVRSVTSQNYQNWEFCIVDDGSNQAVLTAYLTGLPILDKRIKVDVRKTNAGIAAATNAAIAMAEGEYIALLDNDDMLTVDALYWVAKELSEHPDLDLVYSDECKIDNQDRPLELFTKPDWSPSALLNCMYSGHLSVYRRSLVEKLGGLRSTYDFSQDYDLALRVSEASDKIHHIPRILYAWRMIAGSAAQGDKPTARITNIAALADAGQRRGLVAEALPLPTANRLRILPSSMTTMVSIVIPSDNEENILATISSIITNSLYENYEIIVVTNSRIIASMERRGTPARTHLLAFDKPFNFSEKCNVGAQVAQGDLLVFYNDDVRVVSKDWMEVLIETLSGKGVGAASPKLVYEDYRIQHAGMITGVRGLVGTAFHCLPHDTSMHFNMAQWVREVSTLSGACLAVPKAIFEQVGGYDDVNAPIGHSDVDLCFKIREAGYSCVYSPHATLIHIGHLSIGETEKQEKKKKAPKRKDKSNIFLMHRWGHYIERDPYFPPGMRDILFHDSPEPWSFHAAETMPVVTGKDVLLISHDLSGSGAPKVVYEIATMLRARGHFVVVASPNDGPFRLALQKEGIPVVIDSLLLTRHNSVEAFARDFDVVIANTVVTWPAVYQLSASMDEVYWYIHERGLLEDIAARESLFPLALACAAGVWAGSKHAAETIYPYRSDVMVLEYGLQPLVEQPCCRIATPSDLPVRIGLFGSYEPRKGQDLAVLAVAALPPSYRAKVRLTLAGRVLDQGLHEGVVRIAENIPEVTLVGELSYERYTALMLDMDAVLVASRDDTLPLVSLDALGAGKILMCTRTTGTSEYIQHGISGFVAEEATPDSIARALRQAIDRLDAWDRIGSAGRDVFERQFSRNNFLRRLLHAIHLEPAPELERSAAHDLETV